MVQKLGTLTETASQTGGPYVHIGCIPTFAGLPGVYPEDLGLSPIADGAKGEVITITGKSYRLKNRTAKIDEPPSGKNANIEKKSK